MDPKWVIFRLAHFSYSGSALFIKTKNHMCGCPLLKHPCTHFIFAKIKHILTNLIASKYISIRTQGSKNKYKLNTTCVQMFGYAKTWPYYMYYIKSWIFSYKVVT